ncbi:aromatic-ring hydroxylase C-terminal domain-containing protein, partial [Microterricola pindariensis]
TCVGDAANLSWKLAASLAGWAGEGLLASYEHERRPIAARTIADAASNGRSLASDFAHSVLDDDTDAGAEARRLMAQNLEVKRSEFSSLGLVLGYQYPGSPIVVDDGSEQIPEHPIHYTPSTRPGSLLPHVWVGEESLYDALGQWFTLLVDAAEPRLAEFAQAVDAVRGQTGVPVTLLPLDFSAHPEIPWQAAAILVRPDQHVAWRGDEPAAVAQAVAVAVGRASATSDTLDELEGTHRGR